MDILNLYDYVVHFFVSDGTPLQWPVEGAPLGGKVAGDVVGMLWKCCGNAVGMSMLTVYETYTQPCIGPLWWSVTLWHTGSLRGFCEAVELNGGGSGIWMGV